jgi:hypothetical protein
VSGYVSQGSESSKNCVSRIKETVRLTV